MTYGYSRVSTLEQNDDRQIIALTQFGIPLENIYRDKRSGKSFIRPAYQRMMLTLAPGDVLVFTSIDRLGRNYDEIIEQWRLITKERQAAVVVLDMPLLDTRQNENRNLTGVLIADIVLQLLSYVAETERTNIRQRQKEGIAAAKLKGVRFGRPEIEPPERFEGLYQEWVMSKITARNAARELGITHPTFLKWCRRTKIA